MPGWPPPFGGLLPFGFEVALRLKADQKWVQGAGFHTGEPRKFVTVRLLAAGIEEDG